MVWTRFDIAAHGTLVPGDETVPRLRDTLLPFLRAKWRTSVAVFKIDPAAMTRGYRIGIVTGRDRSRIHTTVLHEPAVKVLVGTNDETYFGLDTNGREVPIGLVCIVLVTNPNYWHIRLVA